MFFLKLLPKTATAFGWVCRVYNFTALQPLRYILLLLLCMPYICRAQSLHGIITEANTGRTLYPVTVVNMATQESAYTNERGEFTLPVYPGQQIGITYVGYKHMQRLVTSDMLSGTLKIALTPFRYELDELVVRPNYTPYQLDSLHRRSVYQRTLAWQRTSSVMSPVSFIADRLSSKSKQRYKFQQNYFKWEDEKFIDSRYTPALVTQLTGLTGDSLGYFMNAYPMAYDYARAATELELKMWIRFHYREWLKNPVIHKVDSAIVQGIKKD